eukprot:6196968-Pleurochrysis_carterae.AAC.7
MTTCACSASRTTAVAGCSTKASTTACAATGAATSGRCERLALALWGVAMGVVAEWTTGHACLMRCRKRITLSFSCRSQMLKAPPEEYSVSYKVGTADTAGMPQIPQTGERALLSCHFAAMDQSIMHAEN